MSPKADIKIKKAFEKVADAHSMPHESGRRVFALRGAIITILDMCEELRFKDDQTSFMLIKMLLAMQDGTIPNLSEEKDK